MADVQITTPILDAQGQLATPSVLSQIDARADDRVKVRVPDSGTVGQVLQRTATGTAWAPAPTSLPPGGSPGQYPTPLTGGGYGWADAPKGGSALVLSGPGRPDVPTTTGGIITGSEPVGAEYRSTDGASVGAWTWRKRGTGWVVADGDTGWRRIARTDSWTDANAYYMVRRQGGAVQFITSVKNATGTLVAWPDVWPWTQAVFSGFRPSPGGPGQGLGLTMRVGDTAAVINSDTTRWTTPQHAPANQTLYVNVTVFTNDTWPTAPLIGTPA